MYIVVYVFCTLLSADKTYPAGWKCAFVVNKMAIIANREIINKSVFVEAFGKFKIHHPLQNYQDPVLKGLKCCFC